MKRQISSKKEFYYDKQAAQRVIDFFTQYLVHVKGRWAGQPFTLLGWERDVITQAFGWKKADGTRKYRTIYVEIPRKNGKTSICGGLALYLLMADGESGGEVYCAAGDRAQASLVYNTAKEMYESSKKLEGRLEVFKRTMFHEESMSKYEVLSADAPTKHGLNASGIIIDELHVQPNRDLVDVLVTSTGAREQPLAIMITTAGYDRNSICWEYHEYARQVIAGTIKDETFLGVIYAADEKDDWEDEKTWKKANPSLGHTISMEYLRNEFKKAKEIPAYQNTFRRLHLNQWTSQSTRFIDMSSWNESAGIVDKDELQACICYGGLDLASTIDIAAFALVFPPEEEGQAFKALLFFWIPGDNIQEKIRRDKVPYDLWVEQGYIRATPGNVIDYGFIRRDINALKEQYNIQEIAYDPWNATQITLELAEEDGMTMVPLRQGFQSMSAPTKELLKLIVSKQLHHGNNPVLNWMADNMAVKTDPAGNIKPDKEKSTQRIDGIVALIMALDRASRNINVGSVYEERGLLVI
ncbi:MAG: hypothetical protein BroJett002_37170 [Candidatus Brocadia sinica]|nr:MAG: hypothetical protein BroJett002_37170 [Candidatus Brocadia sinica]